MLKDVSLLSSSPKEKSKAETAWLLFFLYVVNNVGIKQTQGSRAELKQSQHVLHCLGIYVNSKHFQQYPAWALSNTNT